MPRPYLAGALFCSALGMIFVFSGPVVAQAEKDSFDKVKFDTVDQVELHGLFYPSTKGKDAPCALLLHKLVTGSKEKWDKLAVALQKKGYAVLAFDFRGHGDSTTVSPEFWKYKGNVEGIGGHNANDPKKTISHRDFRNPGYYQWLINDIAAAKTFLDRRNDSGACNSSNLILIGEEDGANLGALWMAEEVNRYRAITLPPLAPEKLEPSPESKDIVGAVWLTMNQRVPVGKGPTTNVLTWFKDERIRKIPMAFLYGDADAEGDRFANVAVKVLKGAGKHPEELTAAKSIKGGAKLTGTGLLKETLETEKLIITYLDNLASKKSFNEYDKRDVEGNNFVWKFGNARSVIAKQAKEKQMNIIPLGLLQK
ncbi:MAG: alpha/beta hydrolase [Gemmataceae bacterium]